MHVVEKPETMPSTYALPNRIRPSASDAIRAEAALLTRSITQRYFARNMSIEGLRDLAHSDGAGPLKPSGKGCRADLRSILASV